MYYKDGYDKYAIFIDNGSTLTGKAAEGGRLQLYHNDGKGHFTEVAAKAGLTQVGWAQGVCAGDYDNDGHPDLLVTYYGHNVLYRNSGDGTFEDATARAGLPGAGTRDGSGCAVVDY